MASDSDTSSYSDNNETLSPTRKAYQVKFCESWLLVPEFQSWLVGKSNNTAYCLVCKKSLRLGAGKKDLQRHANTKKHLFNAEERQNREDSSEEDEDDNATNRSSNIWRKHKEFQEWCEIATKDGYVICKFCNKSLRVVNRKDLVRHAETEKHKRNVLLGPAAADSGNNALEKRERFLQMHLVDPELRDWLIEKPEGSAYCKFCKLALRGHRNDFIKHSKSKKHLKNVESPPLEESKSRKPYTKQPKEEIIIEEIFIDNSVDYQNTFSGLDVSDNNIESSTSDFSEPNDEDNGRWSPSTPVSAMNSTVKYKNIWNDDELLNTWLIEKPGGLPYCFMCKTYLTVWSGKKELLKHAGTNKHKNNCALHSNNISAEPEYLESNALETLIESDNEENDIKTNIYNNNSYENTDVIKPAVRHGKFRRQWLSEPDFEGWLCEQPSNTAYCKVCNVYLSTGSGRKDLMRHKASAKHENNEKCLVKEKCRLCLTEHDVKFMPSIFDSDDSTNMKFYKKIRLCSGIKLLKDKTLPNKICLNCTDKLNIVYQFRKLCLMSERHFGEQLQNEKGISYTHLVGGRRKKNKMSSLKQEKTLDYEHNNISEEMVYEQFESIKSDNECDDFEIDADLPNLPMDENDNREAQTSELKQNFRELKVRRHSQPKKIKEEIYVCDICGNHYSQKSKFTAHMKNHSDVKPYECEFCHKRFKQSSQMHVHVRIHTGEKPLKCLYCERRFSSHSTKIKHEMVHRNERPYICTECGKAFTYSTSLKKHRLVHTGEKNFHCMPCGKSFPQKHNLVAHLKTNTHKYTLAKIPSLEQVQIEESVPSEYVQFSISYNIDQVS